MIERVHAGAALRAALRRSRVVALVGPRQCGKTTLARQLLDPAAASYFDLEDYRSLARLDEPLTALGSLRGLVVIDEVQRRPELFPVLRVLADRTPMPARFLVLGSASPALLRQASESLAGRIEVVELGGLEPADLTATVQSRLWLRGGYPRSLLARSNNESLRWRRNLVQTYLERDLPQLGVKLPAPALLRFWTMVAHFHGQIWNAAEPARSLGINESTVRRYLDLLTGLFLVRQLEPWHENVLKRQVKSPKIYIRDSGLLHLLLGIETEQSLLGHPRCGASWEGHVLEQTLRSVEPLQAYFWATHAGAELDLMLMLGSKRVGVEIKRADAPRLTPSMRAALRDLSLDRLFVIYPGPRRYALADNAAAIPFCEVIDRGKAAFAIR